MYPTNGPLPTTCLFAISRHYRANQPVGQDVSIHIIHYEALLSEGILDETEYSGFRDHGRFLELLKLKRKGGTVSNGET